MANPPKGKAKAKPAVAKKPAPRSAKAVTRGAKAKPVDSGQKYLVAGTVTYADSTPAVGLTVIAYDGDESGTDKLGSAATDQAGNYTIRYCEADFRKTKKERGGADVVVYVYDADKTLLFTSKKKNNAPANYELNIKLPARPFVVRGIVTDANHKPAPNLIVRAFDCDLRNDQPVGKESRTNEHGYYEIRYVQEDFTHAEKAAADIKLRIFAPDGKKELMSSEILFNALADQKIDMQLPENSAAKVSVWEQITQVVLPLLAHQGKKWEAILPRQLNDKDIGFIVKESGLDREQLWLWALADKFAHKYELINTETLRPKLRKTRKQVSNASAGSKITAQVIDESLESICFFGWFLNDQPQNFNLLIRRSPEELIASLDRAVAQNQIPPLDKKLKAIVSQALESRRVVEEIKPSAEGEPASLGGALRTMPFAHKLNLDDAKGLGAKIVTMLLNESPQEVSQWQQIHDLVNDNALFNSLQRTIGLSQLTGGHVPLIQALQLDEVDTTAASLADLVKHDRQHWIELAKEHGAPNGMEAETEELRVIQFGQKIAQTIEMMHPVPFVNHRLGNGQITVAAELQKPLTKFLSANPEMRIKDGSVILWLDSDKVQTGGLSKAQIKKIRPEILKIDRIAKLVPSLEYVGPMLKQNYESGRDIVHRHSREVFVDEMKDLVVNEAEAGRIYDAAAGAVASTEALVLAYSPIFKGIDLPVMPLNNQTASPAPRNGMELRSLTLPLKLPANLQQLFGNQDYCECAHGASMYGPAAYLADLLHMLGRGRANAAGLTALQVLLDRRPDLAEIDLTGDNTEITLPYIDLVLEILEAPEILVLPRFPPQSRHYRGNGFDGSLTTGTVPDAMKNDFAILGVQLGGDHDVGGTSAGPWRIRDKNTGVKYCLTHSGAHYSYDLAIYPQSVASAVKGYRPFSNRTSTVVGNVGTATFPWKLPFDTARDETNTWLEQLGATRAGVMQAISTDRWGDVETACEYLNISPAERRILNSALVEEHKDWGFANAAFATPAEEIFDPIAGVVGVFVAGRNQVVWEGGTVRERSDPPVWHALLKNVSLLRSRARLTHRELLSVLETRFVRAGGARLEITGDECNSGKMRLDLMNAELARRIHIFVRLWRKLGWTTVELDRAILAYRAGSAVGGFQVFTDLFLRFVANIARLHASSKLPVLQLLDLFGQPSATSFLDTTEFWDHAGKLPQRTLSRYQQWFDNPTIGKPRVPEFQLHADLRELATMSRPTELQVGLPKPRISDHLTYIAAALALPESELAELLPASSMCLNPQKIEARSEGRPVEVQGSSSKNIEIVLGANSPNSVFLLTVQESDSESDISFENVSAADLSGGVSPLRIDSATQKLTILNYTGTRKYLRCVVTPESGANPSLWIRVRIEKKPGIVSDDLTITNLTALCRYAILRRLIGVPISELRTLMSLTGVASLADINSPEKVLGLLDSRQSLKTLGLTVSQAEQLLLGPSGENAAELNARAVSLLTSIRADYQAIRDETTVADNKRSDLLKNILTGLGWDDRLIGDVLGADGLGSEYGDYEAPLDLIPGFPKSLTYDLAGKLLKVRPVPPQTLQDDVALLLNTQTDLNVLAALRAISGGSDEAQLDLLPSGVTLPASLIYDDATKQFKAPRSTLPNILQNDIANLLTNNTVSGDLRRALNKISAEAVRRVGRLHTAKNWLRAKKLPVHRVSLGPNSAPLHVPVEWKGRFYYDSATAELCLVGWMKEADKTALKLLEVASPPASMTASRQSFERAIDDLYLDSEGYPVPVNNAENALVVLRIEKLLIETDGLEARCGLILEKLLPEWRKQKMHTKLSATLSQSLALTPESAEALLELPTTPPSFETLVTYDQFLASDPATKPTRAAFTQAFDAAARLLILGKLVVQLKMDAGQVPWLGGVWTGLNLTSLPAQRAAISPNWSAVSALASLITLRDKTAVGVAGLQKILDATPTTSTSIAYAPLAVALGCSEDTLRVFAGADEFNIDEPTWFRVPSQLLRLVNCLELILKLNMPAGLFVKLKSSRAPADAEAEVQALRQMALGQSTGNTWTDAERKVLDGIRQRRRDATVDYLVQKHVVRDANDLYGHYLIDPQMNPCMMTSRIKQAISSVQLFIQRCLMNLEPDVSPNMIEVRSWEKHQLQWEVNRKILFHAENWIDTELWPDKSPFFDDAVSSLQQGDATSDKAQLAVQGFLEKLTDLSRMDVVATCSSYDDDGYLLVTHIFARTLAEPRTYWYRQFIKQDVKDPNSSLGIWTAWKPVDLDIEGDHLFPFVWQGRLFLFWAIFSEEAKEPTATELQPNQGKPPKKYWHFKFAWSEFKSGKWSSRRVAGDLTHKDFITDDDRFEQKYFYFSVLEKSPRGVTVRVYAGKGIPNAYFAAFFDGSSLIQAHGEYKYDTSRRSYWFEQDSIAAANAPVDGSAPPAILEHGNMRIKIDHLTKLRDPHNAPSYDPYGVPVTFIGYVLRQGSLLYSPNTGAAHFRARKHLTLSFTIENLPSPFFRLDQLHQFFVYPTWRVEHVFSQTGMFLTLSSMRDVPRLHFYALDWPQANRLRKTLSSSGIDKLLSYDSQEEKQDGGILGYFSDYSVPSNVVAQAPSGDLEFSPHSATAQYNEELFRNLPFSVGCALYKNQRFEEAQRWFHYIFDPTDNSDEVSPARYWRYRPFREAGQGLRIDELVRLLADSGTLTPEQTKAKSDFQTLISMWKEQPFQPHLVARLRIRSFKYAVVMKYVDNLFAWGDQYYHLETLEALNKATQVYVLIAQILGRRPEGIPRRTRPVVKSFSELFSPQRDDLDSLSNALVEAENLIPSTSSGGSALPQGALKSLYFCVPNNPKLLEYYDRVEDRLFKLRNCMNIDGVVRHLPLFEPSIDPSLLVRAAAAGVDVGGVLADLNAPLPFYRFNVMAQKATELCAEVKSLGAALLSAIEKSDAETMALMRSTHELQMLRSVRMVKELQLYEAKANIDAIGVSLESAQKRFTHYVGLVTQMESLSIPTTPVGVTVQSLALAATEALTNVATFVQSGVAMVDPIASASIEMMKQSLARTAEALSATLPPESSATDKVPMNAAEKRQSNELKSAHDLQKKAMEQRLVAQVLAKIPDFTLGAQGWTSSPVVQLTLGGTLLSSFANFSASILDTEASEHSYRAGLHSTLAGYQRRAADWLLQAELAAKEIEQITKQIAASNLRIAIASQELRNHDLQAENAHAVDEFMHSKYTNRELYNWMSGQLSNLYFQSYQLAYDVAKRAERCFKHELGVESSFIKFGYWDNLKKGLLAGENLLSDVKRMEVAYLNQNARELEITKHVSLRQLNPQALLDLRRTGRCEFNIPELLFDLDFPGHYFRRIKSVSVSVPCVVGPYVGVTGTLRLMKSKLRDKAIVSGNYSDEANYKVSYLPTQAIATSTGQNDSGLFELNFRDERYLPSENEGGISYWEFELPANFRAFDYSTISDLILHVRYTAREGGQALAAKAHDSLVNELKNAAGSPLMQLISIRHDFSQQWAAYRAGSDSSLKLTLSDEYFPYLFRTRVHVDPSTITYYSDSAQINGITTTAAAAESKIITVSELSKDLQNVYLLIPYTVAS